MSEMMPAQSHELAVIIVVYNGVRFLPDCLGSLFTSPDAPPPAQVIVVDNASADGSAAWLREHHPHITLLCSAGNLGFAGGNNLAFEYLRQALPHVRYVALLNQDTRVRPSWLQALAQAMEDNPQAAAAQSCLLLHDPPDHYNSAGNWSHFLGFGFVSRFGQKWTPGASPVSPAGAAAPPPAPAALRSLDFPSGAAMMVRVADLASEGLFEPSFGSYLEDAELGWRLRLRGRDVLYVPGSVVEHKYRFAQNDRFYEQLERNRWFLLLAFYRKRTLLLLLPAILAMEGGLLLFFTLKGCPGVKLRAMRAILSPAWRAAVRDARRRRQASRAISDRSFTRHYGACVDFSHLRSPLLTWVGNPILRCYWSIARCLLFW